MSHEPDVDRTVSVSDDDVRVEKSFARDEFPVPVIKFRLVSESDDPVHVRLVDQIPEDFPMEGVGFHPDYESDNWTAYRDHRVEYERSLDPGESTVTVYGIRLDDSSDVAGFLDEPILERPPVPGEAPEDRPGSDVDDILGTDRSQLVRDALQGNGRLANQGAPAAPGDDAPGVEPLSEREDSDRDGDAEPADADPEPADATADDGSDSPEPRAVPTDLTSVLREADSVAPVDVDDDTEPDAVTDADVPDAAEVDVDADAAPAAGAAADATDGLAATLAAEIRSGEVSEADLETLRGEFDSGLPRSDDVRIRRLQSQLADLSAYADAIEEFIDDEGTGAELVKRLDAELENVTAELEDLHDGLDAAADDREALRDGIDGVESDLAATDERLDGVESDLAATDERLDDVDDTAATAAAGVDDVHDRADGIEDHLDDVDSDLDDLMDDIDDVAADVGDVAADLDDTDDYVSRLDDDLEELQAGVSAVGDDVTDTRESLSADIVDLRAEVTALTDELERVDTIEAEIKELQTFRDRLNSAFGPGGGGSGGSGGGSGSDGDK